VAAYGEALGRMVQEFGQGRTATAIAKACDLVPDFVPTPAKIREFIPAQDSKRKTCTLCHPSGYVYVYDGRLVSGAKVDPQVGAVRLCAHDGGLGPVVERDEHEGKGYWENDILLLAKLHRNKRKTVGRELTQAELDELLDDLDVKTGRIWDNFPG